MQFLLASVILIVLGGAWPARGLAFGEVGICEISEDEATDPLCVNPSTNPPPLVWTSQNDLFLVRAPSLPFSHCRSLAGTYFNTEDLYVCGVWWTHSVEISWYWDITISDSVDGAYRVHAWTTIYEQNMGNLHLYWQNEPVSCSPPCTGVPTATGGLPD